MNETYEISIDTLLVIPIEVDQSRIIERDSEFIVNDNTFNIIKNSCEYFGSSYEGRHKGTKNLISVTHKSPIIIEEHNELIFFPTMSPRDDSCIWVNLNEIKNYYVKDHKTALEFNNGYIFSTSVSFGSINNQILRATRLQSVLRKRAHINEKRVSL